MCEDVAVFPLYIVQSFCLIYRKTMRNPRIPLRETCRCTGVWAKSKPVVTRGGCYGLPLIFLALVLIRALTVTD